MNVSVKIETMNLVQAANFLGMNPEVLRQKAHKGQIPGSKVGRGWVFLNIDLVDYLRSQYPDVKQDLQSVEREEEKKKWHSRNEDKLGTSISLLPTDKEYEKALGLQTKGQQANITTG